MSNNAQELDDPFGPPVKEDNANQPAFSAADTIMDGEIHPPFQKGLSKREWFAGMALQGLLALHSGEFPPDSNSAAKKSVEYSDALLAELEKQQQ